MILSYSNNTMKTNIFDWCLNANSKLKFMILNHKILEQFFHCLMNAND